MARPQSVWGCSLASVIVMLGAAVCTQSAQAQQVQSQSRNGTGGTTSSGQRATDPGVRTGTPGAGGPLPGLSQAELSFFNAAQTRFEEVDTVSSGLGPRFNLNSCAGCHAQPSTGGSSPPINPEVAVATLTGAHNTVPSFVTANGPIREARFVRNPDGTPDGGVHNLFVISGRSDASGCNIQQPNFAAAIAARNIIYRIPTPTFGLGLVENVSDLALENAFTGNAHQKGSLGISGNFNHGGNTGNITRFGWKAQNPSLLVFSGEAYNVEMGVTNDAFPNKRETNPGCQYNALPEDTTNLTNTTNSGSSASDYSSDIVNFAAFMRMLAPPTPASSSTSAVAQTSSSTPVATSSASAAAQTSSTTSAASTEVASADATSVLSLAAGTPSSTTTSATSTSSAASIGRGQQVFANIGCSGCHVVSQKTGNSELGPAQTNVTFQPLSDFALHDMGTGLADGVSQGSATGNQFRSAPLWGVGQRTYFLHDGRTNDLSVAIQQHASSGSEANGVVRNYDMLNVSDQQALLNYLRSL
jgi:CxxC motif-containing protein (DUF1111 family)